MESPSHAFTTRCVAQKFGTDQELVEEIAAMQIDPEDGTPSIVDRDNENAASVAVFTSFGIYRLKELLDEQAVSVRNVHIA